MSERLSRERLEEMVEALRRELLLRCGDNKGTTERDCAACEERQPCIHYDSKELLSHIAALEVENERLRDVVKLCRSYVGTGDATADFEAAAQAFHRDTYMMAPGKSEPPGWNSRYTYDQRQMAWEAWLETQTKDVRAALAALDEEVGK